MSGTTDRLAWEDRISLRLRALYEQYGYGRYRMGKFEPYDMYLANRKFLKSETVITFTDASGRLMALKPDVTMSIVKNTPDDAVSRKLYYAENVFRMAHGSMEYREINQIGIESIGCGDIYSEAEVLMLALKTLEVISGEYLLCIGNMGFADAVFRFCGLGGDVYETAADYIRQKNTGALAALADRLGLDEAKKDLLMAVASVSAPLSDAIRTFEELRLPAEAADKLSELRELGEMLQIWGYADKVRVDFSIINDLDYYNGIVFRGFIPGAPRAVLSGGRYDNLMRRFGKHQNAVGFALYSGELSRKFTEEPEYDVDMLIVYGDAAPADVHAAVASALSEGKSVRAEKYPDPDVRAAETVVLSKAEVAGK